LIMRRTFYILSALCFIISFIFIFCLIGYKFTGFLIFVLGAFFLYLALSIGIRKRSLKIIRGIVIALAAIGIIFTTAMTGVVMSRMNGDADIPCDYIIVLGAGLDGETPSLTLVDRLRRCTDYMNDFPESTAIVSGGMGSGETITEALAMERYLISKGISPSRIIKEEKATNTNENLIFSKEIIDERNGGSVAIISSDYHIFRAGKLAEKQGISATMLAARTTLPILRINYAVREGFALVKARLLGHIQELI